jgi:cyclopropane-fatty-acyl-phospholipid synthase
VQYLLRKADIRTDGKRPYDLHVHDEQFYPRLLADGILGLGESYMDGWWDCERLDEFTYRALRADLQGELRLTPDLAWHYLRAKLFNRQTRRRAHQVGREHYDLGNDLFEAMLDPYMQYSCGCWDEADDLAAAQSRKLELICHKLRLGEGLRLLDVGCGWGGLLRFAAEGYGVSGVGLTISREQALYADRWLEGLPVRILLRDYRDLGGEGRFDRAVSVGMFEHVGSKNYRTFFRLVRRSLTEDGLFLLHTIGGNSPKSAASPWTDRYIFPNGQLPSPGQISRAVEGLFVLEDWHSMGQHYDRTLLAWEENFRGAWPELRARYSERFRRMWRFFLLASAGSFRSRRIQLWQIVLSPRGVSGGYAPRRWASNRPAASESFSA